MLFREYLDYLNEFANDMPEILDYEVVYKDNIKCLFFKISDFPKIGFFDREFLDFINDSNLHEFDLDESDMNAISINGG